MTHTLQVPPRFWDDHVDRDCLVEPELSREVKRTKAAITVELTDIDVAELFSDADYYSVPDDLDPSLIGLVRSAQATVKRLRAAFTPEQLVTFAKAYRDHAQHQQDAWRQGKKIAFDLVLNDRIIWVEAADQVAKITEVQHDGDKVHVTIADDSNTWYLTFGRYQDVNMAVEVKA